MRHQDIYDTQATADHHVMDNHIPASEVRVTTEEFSKAVAALELRQQEEASRLVGTVSVGEAIQELHLEATPEEVLAEVEAQRSAELGKTNRAQQKIAFQRRYVVRGAAVCGIVLGLLFIVFPFGEHWLLSKKLRTRSTQTLVTSVYNLDNVADIPNDQVFYCLSYEVDDIINKPTVPSKIQVISDPLMMPLDPWFAPWTLIKHNGIVYIRGWIIKPSGKSDLAQENVFVYNVNNQEASRSGLTPVTLRVGNFHSIGFYSPLLVSDQRTTTNSGFLLISHLRLDKYTWEKW